MNLRSKIINHMTTLFEQQELGPAERIAVPLKFLLVSSFTTIALFVLGSYLWPGLTFVYIWLFLLSMWAILHVKKSTGTWGRFDEIDQRESDYAEEVDRRFEQLQKELKSLKASLKPPKDPSATPKKATKKGKPKKPRSKKAQRVYVEQKEAVSQGQGESTLPPSAESVPEASKE